MNIYLYSHCFNYGLWLYMCCYIFLFCLITENWTLSELDDNVSSHSNHKNGHYHHKLRKNSPKVQFKREPIRIMGRNNKRDYMSSRRTYNNSRFHWQRKLLSPLLSSSFADYRSDVKFSRKNNASASRLKRPNIIFIITDDQDVELGSMKFMPKTLKILGEGGAHFPNSFVTTPMCCPSRSTMLTGLYVHNHNVYTNNDNCSSLYWQTTYETRTFAPYLTNAGYRTAYFGKYLNEYNGTYIPPGWREWSALIRNSKFYNYTLNVNGNKIKHGDIYELDYYPDLIINDSLQFLQYSKRFFANKPLMMVLSFPSPHGPEDAAPKYQNSFLNVTTHRTPSWNYAPNEDKQWLLRRTGKMEKIHTDFTDMLHTKRLQTLQSIDDAVDRLYNELIRIGELDNTYIFYTSDHGYHLGQFGLVKGKSMPFEFDVKVPFYVRGPKITGGMTIDKIVLNIDLAPTFLDIGGVQIPEDMDGNSILPLLQSNFDNFNSNQWRDTFLIERGKSTLETDNKAPALSKKQWLSLECQKPEYRSPCGAYQKFECFFDGNELRIRKCRKNYWNKVINKQYRKHKCICPKEQTTDHYIDDDVFDSKFIDTDAFAKSKRKKLDSYEKKLQRRFLKEHIVNKDFRPVFIGALRAKRDASLIANENFDVNGVYQLNHLLDASMSKAVNNFNSTNVHINSRIGDTSCVVLSNLSVSCSDEIYQNKYVWREKKNRLDLMIKKLQIKLVELKGIRRHLNEKRPLFQTESNGENTDCDCSSIDSYHRNTYVNHKRMRMHFRQRKREKKLRRKTKFENTTCNAEKTNKMKCFTHDNDHWKTPPLWTKGPFCFCQNSNNNSFWCLRTINSTHNFLYCEFVTGFITFYNLLEDPYQLKNAIYDLEFSTLEELRRQLNVMKNCEGNRQCTHNYRSNHNNISHHHNSHRSKNHFTQIN